MNPVLEAALEYRSMGWSVIPIGRQSKKPLVKWTEYQDRLPTEKEIRRWWEEFPAANVAIITGKISGLVVVDIDPKRGGKAKETDDKFPAGYVVKTGSGGSHLYYRHPGGQERVPNQVDQKTGRDVRADGGYVVAPPSRHISGKLYEWKRGSSNSKLPDAPPFALTPPGKNRPDGSKEPWLSEALKGVSAGGRNDTATKLAGYYFSKGLPKDVILQTLSNWNKLNDPPLPAKDLSIIVESVNRTASRHSNSNGAASQVGKPDVEDPFSLMTLDAYMTEFGQMEVQWMIEGWLPTQTIGIMVAPPGTFKTWLEIDVAVSVASGVPFLGRYPVHKTGPVIIIQQEDFHGQMAERVGVVSYSKLNLGDTAEISPGVFSVQIPPELPIYLHPDRRLRFSDSVVLDVLHQKIEALRPVLVIIDPLYSTGNIDDFMAQTVQDMFFLKTMRDIYGCSFLIAHHTRKGAEGSEREGGWGTQFLNAFIETGWQIRPAEAPGTAKIRRHFKVRQNIEEALLRFNINTETMPWRYEVDLIEKQDNPEKFDRKMDIIGLLIEKGPMMRSEIAEHFGVDKSTSSRRIQKLVDGGVVEQLDDGRIALTQ